MKMPMTVERHQDVERPRVIEEDELEPRRHQTQRSIREADVPVRLRARRDGGGVVRSVDPDRVDLEERGDQHDHAERDEEEAAHLGHVDRHHRVADDVAVRAGRAGELRVLVDDHEHQVQQQQADEDRGQQQDVQRVEAADDLVARELPAEQQEGGPGADERDALDHAVDDPQAVAGEQVIGQRVAGEALAHGEDEEDEADHPVELARLAERAGEEHPEHVHADAGDEHQRGPVVDLADEQSTADVERQPQGRVERRGHLHAAHGQVGALVVRRDHRGLEEERQERAGEEHRDEAPQRDLAEHERPVIGEDLAAELLDEARQARALIDVVRRGADEAAAERLLLGLRLEPRGGGCGTQWRSQKLGPTGSVKSLRATRYPSASTVMGSWGSGRAAGPKMTLAPSVTSNCDWWQGHSRWCVCCS